MTRGKHITRDEFAEAVLVQQQRLWGYALKLTRSQVEAEDLLQLTFTRAFENWTHLREIERVGHWLRSVMLRAFIDQCRRNAKISFEPLEEIHNFVCHSAAPDGPTLARDSLQKGLAELARPLALALTLRDGWGFSYEEISELVGCPIGTVRSRISRARRQLLAALTESSPILEQEAAAK